MYKKQILPGITAALEDTPVNLIIGALKTGNSKLSTQIIKEATFTEQSVTLDDAAVLAGALADPLSFLQDLSAYVIIDEVQKASEFFSNIKSS